MAICAVVERSNGTSEPEEDLVGTAYQASSHFCVLTSNVEGVEQELFRSPRNPLKSEIIRRFLILAKLR
jgi:hypothetical protein